MKKFLFVAVVLLQSGTTRSAFASDYGILLLAHGGDAQWNATVSTISAGLDAQAPTEVAFGMADSAALQRAVDKLETRGVHKIVAVPLFVHSRSEVLDQTRYLLGLRAQPSEILRDALAAMPHDMAHHGGHMMAFSTERVRAKEPISMAAALDDSRTVADILARRARALSRAPKTETVVLVAHGPVDDAANAAWLATMKTQAERLRKAGGFKQVVALTIRDDSRPDVKGPALQALRDAVTKASHDGGRAIVVPYLIAQGGIESHIVSALEGLDYAWDGKTLCPDPAIGVWAAKAARSAAR